MPKPLTKARARMLVRIAHDILTEWETQATAAGRALARAGARVRTARTALARAIAEAKRIKAL